MNRTAKNPKTRARRTVTDGGGRLDPPASRSVLAVSKMAVVVRPVPRRVTRASTAVSTTGEGGTRVSKIYGQSSTF